MVEPESDNDSAGASPSTALAAASGECLPQSAAAAFAAAAAAAEESSIFMSSKEQERFLPIANVSRIMKKALPGNAKVSKEAKEAVQECVSEFISFITGEASDKCLRERRKTINGDDLLWGMATLGFDDYVEPLKSYLARYRETEGDKANSGATLRPHYDVLDFTAPPPPPSIDLTQRFPLHQLPSYWIHPRHSHPQQQHATTEN